MKKITGSIYREVGVDSRGRKRYTYRVSYSVYDPNENRMRRTTKRGFQTKQEAADFLTEVNLKNEMLKTKVVSLLSFQPVSDYMKTWLTTVAKNRVKETTLADYERIINTYVIPKIGKIRINEITGVILDEFFQSLAAKGKNDGTGLSMRSLQYIKRVLHKAFSDAVKRQYIENNPCDRMLFEFKGTKFVPTVYTGKEIRELLEAAKGTRMEAPIALAALCGLRRGEVLAVTPADVDFENGSIKITKQVVRVNSRAKINTPKSQNSIRTVLMVPELAEILRRRMTYNEELYLESKSTSYSKPIIRNVNNGTYNPAVFSKEFHKFLISHKLKPLRFHDLRHTYATLLFSLGVPLKTTSELLGHSSVNITADIYTHLTDDAKKVAATRLDAALFKNSSDN